MGIPKQQNTLDVHVFINKWWLKARYLMGQAVIMAENIY
jgi:hypothetical protein